MAMPKPLSNAAPRVQTRVFTTSRPTEVKGGAAGLASGFVPASPSAPHEHAQVRAAAPVDGPAAGGVDLGRTELELLRAASAPAGCRSSATRAGCARPGRASWRWCRCRAARPRSSCSRCWTTPWPPTSRAHIGKRVSLHYEEKVGLPTSCFGETRHFITKVTLTEDIPLAPASRLPNSQRRPVRLCQPLQPMPRRPPAG
jgi:hypothetical protein